MNIFHQSRQYKRLAADWSEFVQGSYMIIFNRELGQGIHAQPLQKYAYQCPCKIASIYQHPSHLTHTVFISLTVSLDLALVCVHVEALKRRCGSCRNEASWWG